MMSQTREANLLGRWWNALIETSATAVAIHYAAPWGAVSDLRS